MGETYGWKGGREERRERENGGIEIEGATWMERREEGAREKGCLSQ